MEGLVQTRGLSFPANAQARAFRPLRSLGGRLCSRSFRLPSVTAIRAPNPIETQPGFGHKPRNPWIASENSLFTAKGGPRKISAGAADGASFLIAPVTAIRGPKPIETQHGVGRKPRNLWISAANSLLSARGGPRNDSIDAANGARLFITDSEEAKPAIFGVDLKTLKKIIPLGFMFFCILFNYTILRDTKDVLVVTAKGSSAEIIPFLKTWVNLPLAVGFMLLYTKLSNLLSKDALFYTVLFPFIAFFWAFAFVLYPLNNVIHPTALADKLLASLGPSFLGPVAILRIWSFCLFYVMAELWGSVVISVLFWGFANQITTVEEAKEFYPLFGLGANIALIFSGRTVKYFSNLRKNLGPGVDGWALSLKGMMSIVVLLGFVICGIYWGVNKFIVNDPSIPRTERKKKEKPKLGMGESLKVLISSRYVRDLATLVVAYGISINLVEVTWKSKLKEQFPSPNEYSSFMGDFSTATGIATFTMMLLGRVILRKFGWGVAAMITPAVLLLTGVGFFGLILCSGPLTPSLATIGLTPLLAAVYVGALQNIFSKSAKYSLFDPCKEMAYIPLDEEMKVKGKAAIDVVCNPLGKSGGALIQQFMILAFGSLATSTPYLGGILLLIVLAWLGAAQSLDSQFSPLAKHLEDEVVVEKVKAPVIDVSTKEAGGLVSKKEIAPLQEPDSIDILSSKTKVKAPVIDVSTKEAGGLVSKEEIAPLHEPGSIDILSSRTNGSALSHDKAPESEISTLRI